MGEYSGNLNYNQIRWTKEEWERIKAYLRPKVRIWGIRTMWFGDRGGDHIAPPGRVRRFIYHNDLGSLVPPKPVVILLVIFVLVMTVAGTVALS